MYTSQVELCSSIVVLDARQGAKPIVFICREQNLIVTSFLFSQSSELPFLLQHQGALS